MNILTEKRNEVTILHLEGDLLGGPEAVKLNEEINRLLDAGQTRLVIDLGQVERMNSSGLGIMINALSTYRQNGGQLKIAHLRDRVRNLLSTTRLDNIFEIYDTIDAALASF